MTTRTRTSWRDYKKNKTTMDNDQIKQIVEALEKLNASLNEKFDKLIEEVSAHGQPN